MIRDFEPASLLQRKNVVFMHAKSKFFRSSFMCYWIPSLTYQIIKNRISYKINAESNWISKFLGLTDTSCWNKRTFFSFIFSLFLSKNWNECIKTNSSQRSVFLLRELLLFNSMNSAKGLLPVFLSRKCLYKDVNTRTIEIP